MKSTRPRRSLKIGTLAAAAAVAALSAAAGPSTAPATGPATQPMVTPIPGKVLAVTVNATAAPDLEHEGQLLAEAAEGEYPRLCRELASPGFVPIDKVTLKFAKIRPGIPAFTDFRSQNAQITLDIDYFHQHPEDLGVAVHELTHVIQHYSLRQPPSWDHRGHRRLHPLVRLDAAGKADPPRPGHGPLRRQLPHHGPVPGLGPAEVQPRPGATIERRLPGGALP